MIGPKSRGGRPEGRIDFLTSSISRQPWRDELSRSSNDLEYVPPKATAISFLVVSWSLFALWMLWSGTYTVDLGALLLPSQDTAAAHSSGGQDEHSAVNIQILILGLLSCAGVAVLCRRMGIVDDETVPVHLILPVLRYLPWLAGSVLSSSILVIRRILRPKAENRPETVVVEGLQHSDLGLATFANSITLTPGTVTIDVTGRTFTVHALMRETADSVYCGQMDRQVAKIDRRHVEGKG